MTKFIIDQDSPPYNRDDQGNNLYRIKMLGGGVLEQLTMEELEFLKETISSFLIKNDYSRGE